MISTGPEYHEEQYLIESGLAEQRGLDIQKETKHKLTQTEEQINKALSAIIVTREKGGKTTEYKLDANTQGFYLQHKVNNTWVKFVSPNNWLNGQK